MFFSLTFSNDFKKLNDFNLDHSTNILFSFIGQVYSELVKYVNMILKKINLKYT